MTLIQELQHKIDTKTKPIKSLGLLEDIALKIGLIQKSLTPHIAKPTMLIYAADHGITEEKVSAFPSEVTPQMVYNFLQEGAAINVFCRLNSLDLKIIDAGVNTDFPTHPKLIHAKAAYGTKNMLHLAAMSEQELNYCFTQGFAHIDNLFTSKVNTVGFGEMGIGNTSSASLLLSRALNIPLNICVGRGTGLDDEGFNKKKQILQRVLDKHPLANTPMQMLQCFGGFEIAQMCGAMLRAYEHNMVLLIDGFICSSAFLMAKLINPKIIDNAIFCHQSQEPGHKILLQNLNQRALLDLDLRLGEGSGCAIAFPIIQSAVAFLNEMASFESAKVSTND